MLRTDRKSSRTGASSGVRAVFDLVVTTLMLATAGFVVWLIVRPPAATAPPPEFPREVVTLEGAPVIGDLRAPVVLIEFSDFECQFCARFAREVWPEVKARWVDTGQVQVVFRHLPLPIHANARLAAEAAVCADRQDRFWPMHDALFAGVPALAATDLRKYATLAGLNPGVFGTCMEGEAEARISEDLTIAAALGVTRTPTFLIGRLEEDRQARLAGALYGALPLEQFEKAITTVGGW